MSTINLQIPIEKELQEQEPQLTPQAEARLRQSIAEIERGEYTECTLEELLDSKTYI